VGTRPAETVHANPSNNVRLKEITLLIRLFVLSLCLCGPRVHAAQHPASDEAPWPAIADFTQGMEHGPGFIPYYLDRERGKLYLSIAADAGEMIYLYSLPQGVGSNDLGLDRGQLMDTLPALVRFRRVGDKVLLQQRNTYYRADSDNDAERRAVEQAFADSVLWGFPVVARNDSAALVDATAFLLRDSHGVARRLQALEQGSYQVDDSASALYYPRIRGFPRNTEFEATVTFKGSEPGEFLRQVAPDAYQFSVRMHHSFVALPEPGYQPRAFDPDSGFWPFSYADYAVPIGEDIERRFIPRHRLHKRDPRAALSDPVEPIIYYLDPGTPEPIRSALLEGAGWWNQAFEAAGYRDAFQVKMLPPDADPMDVRYNVIQWVHRATRGWSYGYGVHDPRTGEIIKGHVTLGSLRVRQDYLIALGMTSPFEGEVGTAPAQEAMALARIRQLSAHEVGHTLGLAHNFAASGRDRASVMDYPHPRIELDGQGVPTLADAYAAGIGDWDKRAIRYGYADFGAAGREPAALAAFLQEGRAQGFRFISDPDSRSAAGLHPASSLWDNGADAPTELLRVMDLRAAALARFGENTIPRGALWSSLERALVPVYYFHRYQVEAAGKWVGGSDYRYARRNPAEPFRFAPVPAADQRRALETLLETLRPEFLLLPEHIAALIPPPAYGSGRDREYPTGYTGAQLDTLSLAEASVQHTLDVLLHPARLARLYQQSAADAGQLSVGELNSVLFERLFGAAPQAGASGALQRRGGAALLGRWRELAASSEASPEVRAAAWQALQDASRWLGRSDGPDLQWEAYYGYQHWLIERFLASPEDLQPMQPAAMPPGSPIG
jgi:hypothetical protein